MRARRVAVRAGTSVLVLWGALTLAFAALHLTPGATVDAIIGSTTVGPQVRQQIIDDYGLDRSIPAQYASYLGHVVTGDLGRSYQLHEPVTAAIGARIGPSLQLTLAAVGLAAVTATTLALLTARRSRVVRGLASGTELAGVSIPVFWAGILLLTVFSFQLGWFPAAGDDDLRALVLPAVAVAIPLTTMLAQVLREGLERVLDEPFVLTARARGMGDAAVRLRHALRHAALPAITLLGWMLGMLIGGLVVTETVFSRQGVGQLMLGAVAGKDLPVVMGVVLLTATVYVVVNIVLDLVYLAVDPRLRTTA
ncbi:ABC transporter permease [Actinomadura flavalba]|uniref:ABC transporter permease n=1 Tax=Actinomadura flavalba TaxID=1120938 RepID=UPI00036809FB|nr:ABC transporter permease [Actinomadura flavalba]